MEREIPIEFKTAKEKKEEVLDLKKKRREITDDFHHQMSDRDRKTLDKLNLRPDEVLYPQHDIYSNMTTHPKKDDRGHL